MLIKSAAPFGSREITKVDFTPAFQSDSAEMIALYISVIDREIEKAV